MSQRLVLEGAAEGRHGSGSLCIYSGLTGPDLFNPASFLAPTTTVTSTTIPSDHYFTLVVDSEFLHQPPGSNR